MFWFLHRLLIDLNPVEATSSAKTARLAKSFQKLSRKSWASMAHMSHCRFGRKKGIYNFYKQKAEAVHAGGSSSSSARPVAMDMSAADSAGGGPGQS
jgi:hypothetical protein